MADEFDPAHHDLSGLVDEVLMPLLKDTTEEFGVCPVCTMDALILQVTTTMLCDSDKEEVEKYLDSLRARVIKVLGRLHDRSKMH